MKDAYKTGQTAGSASMANLNDYRILGKIYEQVNTLAYRVVRISDQKPFILKTSTSDYPSPQITANLEREFQIIKKLASPGIIKAYDLIKIDNKTALILEDIEGQTLKQFLAHRTLNLTDFFQIALQLIDIIGILHQHRIIHKDINPNNIVIDPQTLRVQIIDFNIAAESVYETQEAVPPSVLEGTLAYISPEQTGRMNRLLDYRTDFYSLGVTFFEMLTGQLPFTTEDPLELIHCHIAKLPADVSIINLQVPKAVAEIITKLMAKEPEDRYLSASGIEYDLHECQRQWQATQVVTTFALGQHDYDNELHISQKLYGREEQINTLLAAFERVSQGNAEIMVISGYSGIGKTSLVNQVNKPITRQQGYFITGKFDQLKRTTPYSAIIKAFQELVKQALLEPDYKLSQIKENLLSVLGESAQVIIEVIPEVELITGKQPPIIALNPVEAQNRFQILFQNFVGVFTQPERPLVIFLDDLQWADIASLKFIQLLLTDPSVRYLLIIGAYRDNEVTPEHPLLMTLRELQKANVNLNKIELRPLQINDINQLLSDTLHQAVERVSPLGTLIQQKTNGNPFFVGEFLKTIYQQKLLWFSYEEKDWQWDLTDIDRENITNNVVDLLISKIQQLSPKLQEILQLAACIGNVFNLETLSIISKREPQEIGSKLWQATQDGLVLPIGYNYKQIATYIGTEIPKDLTNKIFYKFLHDRVQQAAYNTISPDYRQEIHLSIGRLLLQGKPLDAQDDRLFEILNHFNQSLSLVTAPKEKETLAQYNLWAGNKAMTSTAYDAALQYLDAGSLLLSEDLWETNYPLMFPLYKALAECSHLVGQYARAENDFSILLTKAKDKFDKASIYEIKITLYGTMAKYKEGLKLGSVALSLFGVKLPLEVNRWDILKEIIHVKWQIGLKHPSSLQLKPMTDPEHIAIEKLLVPILTIAYIHNPDLFILISCKMFSISLAYGYSKYTDTAAMAFALIVVNGLNDYRGFEYATLSANLAKKNHFLPSIIQSISAFSFFLSHWKEPISSTLPQVLKNYHMALEIGEMVFAEYNLGMYANLLFDMGRPLPEVAKASKNLLTFLVRIKTEAFYDFYSNLETFCLYLENEKDIKIEKLLSFEANIEHSENKTEICYLYLLAARIYYFLDDPEKSLQACIKSDVYNDYTRGMLINAKNKTFYALALAGSYHKANPKQQRQFMRRLNSLLRQVKRWAKWCPINFEPDYFLIAAEIANLKQDYTMAANNYDKAIQTAQDSDFTHLIAIANERAARFYLSINKSKIAKTYFLDAHYAYRKWGATTKVKLYEEQYPQWFTQVKPAPISTTLSMTPSISATVGSLDLLSIVKATQAISGEINFTSLLQKLMNIMLENAGAQTGTLLVNTGGRWTIDSQIKHNNPAIILPRIPFEDYQQLPHTLINYIQRTQETILLNDASHSSAFSEDPYIVETQPKSILCMPIVFHNQLAAILYLENNATTNAFSQAHIDGLKLLAGQVAISLENAKLYAAGKRFVPYEFLSQLKKRNLAEVALSDHIQKKFSILFCDIIGFTKLSEKLTPAETFKFINKFLGLMEPIITRHSGFIDKYIGDAILALFYQRADNAVEAAIDMHKTLQILNQQRREAGEEPVNVGIGINTGELMLGIIGSEVRLESSVIGDAVNIAAHIERLTRIYHLPLLVSGNTKASLQQPQNFQLQYVDTVHMKGKIETVDIYSINIESP